MEKKSEMTRCNNTKVGVMLHAFELGMLATADRQEFEEHLLECSHCFELVQRHKGEIEVLNTNVEIQKEIIEGHGNALDEINQEPASAPKTGGRTKLFMWLSLAAVVIYVSITQFSSEFSDEVQLVQEIQFKELRSVDNAVIKHDMGGMAVFSVPLVDSLSLDNLYISLTTVSGGVKIKGVTVLSREAGYIKLEVPVLAFTKGLYKIRIELQSSSKDSIISTFTFRVK